MDRVQHGVFPQGQEDNKKTGHHHEELGDFSTTLRVLPISASAIVIGVICAFVALALLRMIGLFTNLFYFDDWGTALISPAGNHPDRGEFRNEKGTLTNRNAIAC